MRLLTNIISVDFLSKEVDFVAELATDREDIGSHSKIGVPDMALRDGFEQMSNSNFFTAQLIVIALAGFNTQKDGTIQQQIDHDALGRFSQKLKKLRPWCLLDGGNPLVEV